MTPLFTKLNLADHRGLVVLDAPPEFDAALAALEDVTVHRQAGDATGLQFAIAFVQTLDQVERVARELAPRLLGDAVLWCAYPKGASRRYRCEFNRDSGWAAMGAAGFEPVRQVAIDEDWSALRFRRVEYIARLRRDPARALTATGRARAGATRSSRA